MPSLLEHVGSRRRAHSDRPLLWMIWKYGWTNVPFLSIYARRLVTIATCYIRIKGRGADIHLSRVACLYIAALNTEVTSLTCLVVYAFPHEKE